ncbi:MAG: sulfatase [Rubripirellula sp.]
MNFPNSLEISRRVFVALLGVCCFHFASSDHVQADERPNVLMIAIDDLNDWVGCLDGHPQASTPNIDRLSRRGVLFSNAHCQAPICNPSRTSLMLGKRPSTTGIYLNSPWFRDTTANASNITLPEYFAQQGYETLTTGKIYHGSRVDPKSFQTVGPRPGQRLKQDEQLVQGIGAKSKLWDFGAQQYPEDQFGDAITATWAVDQINSDHERPFFLAAGFYRPHVPFYAPQRFFDSRPLADVMLPDVNDDDRSDLPEAAIELVDNKTPPSHQWFVTSGQWQPAVQSYMASVSFTDAQVGRLLDALDNSPHRNNTIIVLFSDHGFHLGEKQRWAKQSLWERSTRVPLIVCVPKGLQGVRSTRPVELLSLYPTLLELCGLPSKDGLEGVSLTPLLSEPDAKWNHAAITTYQANNHAVRSDRYRYIRYADGSEELYDHESDPREWNNLAGNSEFEAIKRQHAEWIPDVNVPAAQGKRSAAKSKGARQRKSGRNRSAKESSRRQ